MGKKRLKVCGLKVHLEGSVEDLLKSSCPSILSFELSIPASFEAGFPLSLSNGSIKRQMEENRKSETVIDAPFLRRPQNLMFGNLYSQAIRS